MRKYGKYLLLVAVAALAAMAIGAGSASAATVNNPGSHSVQTTNLTLIAPNGTIHCTVSLALYVSSNADTLITGVTVTNCTPAVTVTTSNVPVSTNGAPPASPWSSWSGSVSGGGPDDWTGTLANVQFNIFNGFYNCSYAGNMNVVYHNDATTPSDNGNFTASGSLPRVSGSALCGAGNGTLSTNDGTTEHPFTFSAGDAGFTIS